MRAGDPAQAIVGRGQPSSDTLTLARPACLAARARSASRPRPPVVMVGVMPELADLAHDLEPVFAQVGLAADQRDLADAELGHLMHEVQALGRS